MTKQRVIESLMKFRCLPFQVGVSERHTYSDAPDLLPFEVGRDEALNLLVQVPNPVVTKALEVAYTRGSVLGNPLSSQGIGRSYADDYLAFLDECIGLEELKDARVLEIGCGSGYLLHRLQQTGATVVGIEPGPMALEATARYGLEVHRGVVSPRIRQRLGQFDLVLTYAVMEHLEDPVRFLELQSSMLKRGGRIALSVPDCSDFIDAGDPSMFLHEHWSYFSLDSLVRTLEFAGLAVESVQRSQYGDALYCVTTDSGSRGLAQERKQSSLHEFEPKLRQGLRELEELVEQQDSLGIFCPTRAVNALWLVQPERWPRFFDDEPRLHGRFFPPIPVPVESREDLRRRPVDTLIVMSRAFGRVIVGQLAEVQVLSAINYNILDDLFPVSSRIGAAEESTYSTREPSWWSRRR